MEKLRSFTYWFFELMFFAGLGLYFVRVTPVPIVAGLGVFGVALASGALVGGCPRVSYGSTGGATPSGPPSTEGSKQPFWSPRSPRLSRQRGPSFCP